jgi:signal transduction histidine kinase
MFVNLFGGSKESTRRGRDRDRGVRLFDEIQDKSRQLAEASQHKSQFIANMSHELRTPLNVIIGVTEMLRDPVTWDRRCARATSTGPGEGPIR